MRRSLNLFVVMVIAAAFIFMGIATGALAKDIKVGAIINLTGPASTWGQFHAKGHKDYFRYVNEVKGGSVPCQRPQGLLPLRERGERRSLR
jgi:hypothetical protein